AVCDSVGNQSIAHLSYVPDDIYIDDQYPACLEISGSWENFTEGQLWDLGARLLRGTGSIGITPDIPESRPYLLFYHSPGSTSDSLRYIIQNSTINDTLLHTGTLRGINHWQYIGIFDLEAGQGNTIIIENLASDKDLGMDVIRITPLIADKHFILNRDILTFGNVSVEDTAVQYLEIFNRGSEEMNVISMKHYGKKISIDEEFPLILGPMDQRRIPVSFSSSEFCEYNDVIIIQTDDPKHTTTIVPVYAGALTFYKIVDDLDSLNYREYGDNWRNSVARAWGPTSRYTGIRSNGDHADFTKILKYSGTYDLQFVVPTTVNAHDHAHYILLIDGVPQDTVIVNQNANSGQFVSIGQYDLPKDVQVTLRVQDNGGNTNTGAVLRADAVKFLLIEEKFVSAINEAGIPDKFKVFPNYPNPFNPSTQIYFALPAAGEVRIDFYDIRGRKVDRQIQKHFEAGYHRVNWTPAGLSSGMYMYRVESTMGVHIGKCTFIK
ncbi:MAG: T9SS type A sorting domain-containing protein, partial [FCB group bacterium]|nr:T9SS type A sorting domain-containing protein [FCB group bacterium]